MAKKKSERYRPRRGVRVIDNGYIMGYLGVSRMMGTVLDSGQRVEVAWVEVTFKPFAMSILPSLELEMSPSDLRRQLRMNLRVTGKSKSVRWDSLDNDRVEYANGLIQYIVFPDFRIRAEKLIPVLEKLEQNDIREIEYSQLRKILRM